MASYTELPRRVANLVEWEEWYLDLAEMGEQRLTGAIEREAQQIAASLMGQAQALCDDPSDQVAPFGRSVKALWEVMWRMTGRQDS